MSELFALVLCRLDVVGVLGVVLVAVLCLLAALIVVRTVGVLILRLVLVLALILILFLLVFHCVNAPWFDLIAGIDCFPTAKKVLPETGELFM